MQWKRREWEWGFKDLDEPSREMEEVQALTDKPIMLTLEMFLHVHMQ